MHSQHLEYFRKVAEYGSFSRAAVSLGINQSALSRHVRNLEVGLGIALFYRNGRGVILTEDGKRLLERAMRVLKEIELAKQEANDARAGVYGSVTIGLTPTVGRVLTLPLAKKLTGKFSNIRLRFVEGFSAHLLEWLDTGSVDMAVLYQGWATGRLPSEKMITEKLCLIASAKHKKLGRRTPTAQLARYSLILPSAPHGLRRLLDTVAREQKVILNIPIEADSFDSILDSCDCQSRLHGSSRSGDPGGTFTQSVAGVTSYRAGSDAHAHPGNAQSSSDGAGLRANRECNKNGTEALRV